MKKRNILYGYEYRDGTIVVNNKECAVVKFIFNSYLDGVSLLGIADSLNVKQIEYMPGVTGWNKARLKHIIDDERYTGTDTYPNIIDENVREEVKRLKYKKNTRKSTDRSKVIFNLHTPVICPVCGSKMRRFHDSRQKCTERWCCENSECKVTIKMSDEELLEQITMVLNCLINNPDIICCSTQIGILTSPETLKLENDIKRSLEQCTKDKDKLRQKMLKYISLKYMDINNDDYHISKQLKADFNK